VALWAVLAIEVAMLFIDGGLLNRVAKKNIILVFRYFLRLFLRIEEKSYHRRMQGVSGQWVS
jgi:hypothetical protein